MKTIEQAIQATASCLASAGIESPVLESEFLIAAYLRTPRTRLVLDRGAPLHPNQVRGLGKWVKARQMRKPLAYITGEQPFRDLLLKVNSHVLVPRPETELLVEQALRVLDRQREPIMAVDVGTGSGNIALSLAPHPHARRVIAIDRSRAALRVARANEERAAHHVPIRWMLGNLLQPLLEKNLRAQLIVANLPYVRTDEFAELDPELRWEPQSALDGGEDGQRLIEPCVRQAADVMSPGGTLLLEIGARQGREIASLLENENKWLDIRILCDLSGLPRIAQAQRKAI